MHPNIAEGSLLDLYNALALALEPVLTATSGPYLEIIVWGGETCVYNYYNTKLCFVSAAEV